MRVMLTSCGLETETIKSLFVSMLNRKTTEVRALFIPTAANDVNAIEVLTKCIYDLVKCNIPKENIAVFDLHRNMTINELQLFDVVYLAGGSATYLLSRINDTGFRDTLMAYIQNNGFVIGVSAGSLVFANNLPNNLGLLDTKLDVHCEKSSVVGKVSLPQLRNIRLSNTAAMLIRDIPDNMEIID